MFSALVEGYCSWLNIFGAFKMAGTPLDRRFCGPQSWSEPHWRAHAWGERERHTHIHPSPPTVFAAELIFPVDVLWEMSSIATALIWIIADGSAIMVASELWNAQQLLGCSDDGKWSSYDIPPKFPCVICSRLPVRTKCIQELVKSIVYLIG
jgi:hypothetical protein